MRVLLLQNHRFKQLSHGTVPESWQVTRQDIFENLSLSRGFLVPYDLVLLGFLREQERIDTSWDRYDHIVNAAKDSNCVVVLWCPEPETYGQTMAKAEAWGVPVTQKNDLTLRDICSQNYVTNHPAAHTTRTPAEYGDSTSVPNNSPVIPILLGLLVITVVAVFWQRYVNDTGKQVIIDKGTELHNLTNHLENAEEELKQKEKEVGDKNNKINELTKRLEEKEKEVGDLSTKLGIEKDKLRQFKLLAASVDP